MYRQTLDITCRLYPFVLLAILGELILRVLMEKGLWGNSSGGLSISILYSILAFYAHVDILSLGPLNRETMVKRWLGFIFRTIGLIFLITLPAIIVTIALYHGSGLADRQSDQPTSETVALIMLPVVALFSLLVYGLLGTLLPAFVVDRGRGVGAAIDRGRATFWYVTGRLIIGPGFLFFVSLFAFAYIPVVTDLPGTYFQNGWQPNLSKFGYAIIVNTVQCGAIVMTAWIFSTTFLLSEAEPEAAEYA
ncbi:MAG: hypothetical protein V7723_15405 [Sneathiella sp.]|uniref:hypothetical protein n=1 Tax=Sneathiella sp. TaxID=1964365 RepID=UPI0030032BED